MNERQVKARMLVGEHHVRSGPGCYLVRSQSGAGATYRVTLDGLFPSCTCDDFELTGRECKHMIAARIHRAEEGTVPPTVYQPQPPLKKKTYPQVWDRYNAAQVNEGRHFKELLFDLCQTIPEPERPVRRGRPSLSVRDGVYAACLKVYGGMSARRSMSDVEEAKEAGYLSSVPHFNSVLNVLDNPATGPILTELIRLSSLPLASVEVDFAVDSTGFGMIGNQDKTWYRHKYGTEYKCGRWVKLHACCGVKTNIVTAALADAEYSADSPRFPGLVKETARGFTIQEVSGDKAYTCTENLQTVEDLGGVLYAPFKSNATGATGGIFERAFHFFNLHRDRFLEHYHQRSNIESTFSAIKRKFGDSVRGKSVTSGRNEVLAKLVCYNLTVTIMEWYTLGIQPVFLSQPEENPEILRMPRRG